MRSFVSFVLAAAVVATAFAGDAFAGTLTSATGPIKVNGKEAKLPVEIKKGDVIETGSSAATFKSDAGDLITLDRATKAKSEGSVEGVEYLFIASGSAQADLSNKTSLGVATSWATAAKDMRTEVRVEAPADRASTEGRFRTIKGGTWLRNEPYAVWLPEAQSVTLWSDAKKPGGMCFRTSQQNTGRVEVTKQVGAGAIHASVPRATNGCVESLANNKTKVSNEITSNKQEKIQVWTEFGSKAKADVGPGTYAVIDNQTGGIEVIEEFIDDDFNAEIPDFQPVDDAAISVSRTRKR